MSSLTVGRCGNCYRIWRRDHHEPNAVCDACARPYYRRPGASPSGKTCCRPCYVKWKLGRNWHNQPTDGATMVSRVCACCGSQFSVEKRQVDKGNGLYCSLQCNAIRKRLDPARSSYPENAWRQREGFTKLSQRMLGSPGIRCETCGSPRMNGNLVVHHPIPPEGSRELLFAPWNLMILCRACHMRVHRHDLKAEAA